MRKIVQKQIMDMIPAIWDGVQYIQTAESSRVLQLLDDCLLAMETLQESFRSGLSPQRFLYYKQYYGQVVLAMKQLKDIEANEDQILCIYNGLDKILSDVTNEAEVKIEILFLPYKASMWDSLESIWLAAKDDSKCDAYVMPIPYCDRNPDGSPLEWHCEADLFPEYVPVTDFNQYDIAKRKPDVVYIHNPYDEYNRVTSVDPKYYSSELKKHTDMLVYVPYFVVDNAIAPHFCQVAGVINADKVIVESEEIKKQYELAYPGGNPPENKFLALGSPKFDKVLHSSRADFILPPKWKELLHGKKVVFYNTSLAAMLENPNEANEKLRHVLSIFKNRKDVILWWRPHPLIKETMQSMHPEIFNEYEKIEQEYKSMAWGIYDDSADLHRAIAWSDAYYGDRSSVVSLYKVTGKPIMIECMDKIDSKNLKVNYTLLDAVLDKAQYLWFVDVEFDILCRLDIVTGNVKCIQLFEEIYKLNGDAKYCSVVKIENKILLAPLTGLSLLVYDILTDQFEHILLDSQYQEKYIRSCQGMFVDIVRSEECAILVPLGYSAFVSYNTKTGELIYFDRWFKELSQYIDNKNDFLFAYRGENIIINQHLYIPFLQKNIILRINVKNGGYKLLHVSGDNKGYYGGVFDGKDYWLLPYTGDSITKYDLNTKKSISYKCNLPDFIYRGNVPFISISCNKDNIILYQGTANMSVVLDKNSGLMKKSDFAEGEFVFATEDVDGNFISVNIQQQADLYIKTKNKKMHYNLEIADTILEEIYRNENKKQLTKEILGTEKDIGALLGKNLCTNRMNEKKCMLSGERIHKFNLCDSI